MTKAEYLQNGIEKKLDHLAEECGEFIAAYGKMRRWGALSYNPELPLEERELNIDWVMREAEDVLEAAIRLDNEGEPSIDELETAFP